MSVFLKISLSKYYEEYDRVTREEQNALALRNKLVPSIRSYALSGIKNTSDGFKRMMICRKGLEAIDRRGWTRSFHQRQFHDHFMRSCARVFWKTDSPGQFTRDHMKILEVNGWDSLSQEVLVSTPRRCPIVMEG